MNGEQWTHIVWYKLYIYIKVFESLQRDWNLKISADANFKDPLTTVNFTPVSVRQPVTETEHNTGEPGWLTIKPGQAVECPRHMLQAYNLSSAGLLGVKPDVITLV